MRKFRGVVFDLNGTLIWDTRLHNQAWDTFLARHNLVLSDHQKNEKIHGRNNELIFPAIFERELSAAEIAHYISEKEAIYRDLCIRGGIGFAPGAVDFIRFLKGVQVPVAIATASGRENVDFYNRYVGLGNLVDERLIVYNDGSYRSKPDPHIFLEAIKRLHLDSRQIIIFEDSLAGIEAARRANAGSIIIVNSNQENYTQFGYRVITSFDQVDRNFFLSSG
jgi:beta-phosphoglucomutase-like phosphatase (HAD superfamily)